MKFKKSVPVLALLILQLTILSTTAQQKPLLETPHYSFYSNPLVNEHLFLYQQAIKIKRAKTPDDSIMYALKLPQSFSAKEKDALLLAIKYYRDSLSIKDLLFDSTMRDFEDKITLESPSAKVFTGWQATAFQQLGAFSKIYKNVLWASHDSANKAWLKNVKDELLRIENEMIGRLQTIFQDTLPSGKVRIDITTYATFTGAYTYKNTFPHITFSSVEKNNQGRLGTEVVLHETSHLLIDKVNTMIFAIASTRTIKKNINLWHNLLFYTTGIVMKEKYADFKPFYEVLGFKEKIPDFKLTTDSFDQHWVAYLQNKITMQEALEKIIDEVNKK